MIAVCTIGCDRKAAEGFPSWPHLFALDGDYHLYFNYELSPAPCPSNFDGSTNPMALQLEHWAEGKDRKWSFDLWKWTPNVAGIPWRELPKFDQDVARHKATTTARNMCRMFAQEIQATHLLFIDVDIIPPHDIIPKLLAVGRDAVCGLVYGRGVHSACPYIFGEKRRWQQDGYTLTEVEHANIGFTMLSRKLFETVAIRYGRAIYPDGRDQLVSDDPAFHCDCFRIFGEWPVIRMDVVGTHVGDLKAEDVSQY